MMMRKAVLPLAALLAGLGAPAAFAQDGPVVAPADGPYTTTFLSLGPGEPGYILRQRRPGPKARIAVLVIHPTADFLRLRDGDPCTNLAARGYTVLCANTPTDKAGVQGDADEERLLLNVAAGVRFLRGEPGVAKVVIFGHSAGGGLMSAYQNIAENGAAACNGPEKLIACSDKVAHLPVPDGLLLIDGTYGSPWTALLSVDPAVPDDESGQPLDPALDMYNPANGYDPEGAHYSPAFIARFQAAQGARMNRLIDRAETRLALIRAGKGRFRDDEPFFVSAANPNVNKLNATDLSLQSQTVKPHTLLHAGGRATTEIVHSVRVVRPGPSPSPKLEGGSIITTVKRFLMTYAVRTRAGYGYDASTVHGLDYHSSWAVALNNVEGVRRPILVMGMTGSYEYWVAESDFEHAASNDKTLAYVEGAVHGFTPCTECAIAKGLPANYYGDTVKTLFDYIDGWLSKPGRL